MLELGRNKFEGEASEFQDLEKAFWVGGPKWVEWGSNLFGHVLKGEVRTFAGADLPAAWTWIKA